MTSVYCSDMWRTEAAEFTNREHRRGDKITPWVTSDEEVNGTEKEQRMEIKRDRLNK